MRLLTVLFALLVAAAHPFAQERTITIGVDDTMKYSVTSITAAPGEKLKVVLKSTSTMPRLAMAHNFVLLQAGTKVEPFLKAGAGNRDADFIAPAERSKVIAATAMLGPGETAEVSFTVPAQRGTYPFICTFTGHYAMGMKGTLTVK